MAKKSVIVIGGGYAGLSAAYDLAKAGHAVSVIERDAELGGLAGTFELSPGYRIEKFYHHWFTSDVDIISFIEQLGLASGLKYLPSNNGLFFANSIFRLANPLDLLRFNPLPFFDRVRTGVMAVAARSIKDWMPLEDISAEDWIRKVGGRRSYEVIWQPLLKGKFGPEAPNVSAVWFWNKLKLRGSSRDKKGGESLVYFDGGFTRVTEAMTSELRKAGGEAVTGCEVQQIVCENGRAVGVRTPQGERRADIVLCTSPLPIFLGIAPSLPPDYVHKASQIRFLGNVCLVMRLSRSLSNTYWLNVADPNFPYVGIIEHTNFDPPANYGGEHVAYLSKYLPTNEAMFSMSEEELFRFSLPHLKRMFPLFSEDWVVGYRAWRAEFSQPVITKHYSRLIPDMRTPIENLWLCTMAQVYPEDRGTNYAVRYGRRAAARILESIGSAA